MKSPCVSLRGLLAVLAGVWFWGTVCALAEPDWLYEGGELPVPPGQAQPWKLPKTTKIPGSPEGWRQVLDATRELFAAGWADPRGCEYREIAVPRNGWREIGGDDGRLATRGWVLPAAEGPQRYAVAWDGLVYPVISVGKLASVAEDVKLALEGKEAMPFPQDGKALAPDKAALTKVVMLLRLDRGEEAGRIWQHMGATTKEVVQDEDNPGLFATLATEWLQAQFDRAVWAHLRGQSRLALAYLEPISKARSNIIEEAAKRGVKIAEFDPQTGRMGPGLNLAFLSQTSALIKDERRRIAENVTSRPEIEDPESIADKAQRIALLIRALEDVEAHPMTSKGYIEFSMAPAVVALVEQGEDAIEPLIECLAHDMRLTRSIDSFWGNRTMRVVGVEEPARAALMRILRSRDQLPNLDVPYVNSGPMAPKLPREELAGAIRTYWEKYRGKTLAERWHGLLADDTALPRVWAEAAENLALKESQQVPVYGWMMTAFPQGLPGEPDPMRGETLRGKTKPSISELMARRLKEACAAEKESGDFFAMNTVERLAKALAAWDGRNQLETLRWYGGELAQAAAGEIEYGRTGPLNELIRAYLARKEAGDEQAMADYTRWLRGQDARKLAEIAYREGVIFFAPLWLNPADPAIAALTKQLFLDPTSPWASGVEGTNPAWVAEAARSPLVAVAEFRAVLLETLKNETVAGSVQTVPPWHVIYSRAFARSGYQSNPEELPGPKQDVRLGDKIAQGISTIRGAPAFALQWPKKERDAAIGEIAAFLRDYGDRLAPTKEELGRQPFRDAELRFPPLDRPATKEDVAAGRAIFSREGGGERRVWPLPEWPMLAHWTTLKDYPYGNAIEAGEPAGYDQDVRVWQAEETLINGRWQRTFGVVAKNRLAAVPAKEIELVYSYPHSGNDGWRLAGKLAGRRIERGELTALKHGEPAPVILRIQNTRGVARRIPGPEKGPTEAGKIGLTIRMDYFHGSANALAFGAKKAPEWKTLEPLQPVQVEVISAPRDLEALEAVDYIAFDLAKFFDLNNRGIYRLVAVFAKDGIFETEHTVPGVLFEVKNNPPAPPADAR